MGPAFWTIAGLTQFLIERQHAGRINADLRRLIESIARACKAISTWVNKGPLGGAYGSAGTENVDSAHGTGADTRTRAASTLLMTSATDDASMNLGQPRGRRHAQTFSGIQP